MGNGPTRIVPRPSERMAGPRGRASTVDLRDPGSRSRELPKTSRPAGLSGRDRSLRSSFLTLAGVSAGAAAVSFGFLGLTGRADTTPGLVVAPVLTTIALVLINRWVRPRLGDVTAAILVAGFGLRMLGAVPRLLGGADSPVYYREGVRIAVALRNFDFGVDTGRAIPGTGSVRYFTGVVNVATGSTYIATFLLFASIAFVGQVFFLMATERALNPKQFRVLAIGLMVSPTLAYWPSSVGKESLSLLGIGLGAFGAAKLYDRHWHGLWFVLLGSFSVGMVRPHVAMVLLIGLFVGLLARRHHTRGRIATHLTFLGLILVASMVTAGASATLFGLESFDGVSDVNAALDFAQQRTSQDEAQFVAARVQNPLDYPWAALTVLFRPFPWEADSAASLVSAGESTLIFLFLLRALPGLFNSAGQLVQRGQLLYSVAFTAVFVYVFSAIGNFGILSRQRAQVTPFILLFIAFGLGAEHVRNSRRRSAPERRR